MWYGLLSTLLQYPLTILVNLNDYLVKTWIVTSNMMGNNIADKWHLSGNQVVQRYISQIIRSGLFGAVISLAHGGLLDTGPRKNTTTRKPRSRLHRLFPKFPKVILKVQSSTDWHQTKQDTRNHWLRRELILVCPVMVFSGNFITALHCHSMDRQHVHRSDNDNDNDNEYILLPCIHRGYTPHK